jgi:small subunit ribosomal protein S16
MNKCGNRPFFRIVLMQNNLQANDPFLEDLGTYDPLPNKNNEIMVALNYERIKYYMGRGIIIKEGVLELLGKQIFLFRLGL